MSIWDIVQQVQIERLKGQVAGSGAAMAHAAGEARSLGIDANVRLERLVLVTEAMWELLSERLGVTVTELAERVRQIDARDGQVDGRHGATQGAPLLHCSACQATIPPGKTSCQFCGAPAPGTKTDPFRI
ncbi:MAG TPA: hypothetical protein VGR66_12545 [Candidatus Eisenbacteria bacterium]|jgi:hypothetical protein|nr:hypothetical protein [Candidatus Eisenbacteria bacterium]